jgi:hypothetical protein
VSRPLTANTIEKWRAAFANWLISVASRAHEGSYYTSQPVTTGEPIISIAGRGKRLQGKTRPGPQSFRGIAFAHAGCSIRPTVPSTSIGFIAQRPSAWN